MTDKEFDYAMQIIMVDLEIKIDIDLAIDRINKWNKEETCSFIRKEIEFITIAIGKEIDYDWGLRIVDSTLDILYDIGAISKGCYVVTYREFHWIEYIDDNEYSELKTQKDYEEYFGEDFADYFYEEEAKEVAKSKEHYEGVADIDFEKYEIDAETLYHHYMEEIEEGK